MEYIPIVEKDVSLYILEDNENNTVLLCGSSYFRVEVLLDEARDDRRKLSSGPPLAARFEQIEATTIPVALGAKTN